MLISLVVVIDPVMGDEGEFYVSKTLLPWYRDKLISLASMLLPNQFELEQVNILLDETKA